MKKTLLFVILTIIALALLPAASVASETGQKITVGNYIITYDPGEPVIVNNVSYDDRGVPAEGIVFFNKNKSLFGLISLEKYDPQANLTDKMVKGMEDSGTYLGKRKETFFGHNYTAVIGYNETINQSVTRMMVPIDTNVVLDAIISTNVFDRIVGTVQTYKSVQKTGLIATKDYWVTFDAGPGTTVLKNGTYEDDGVAVMAISLKNAEGDIVGISIGPYGKVNLTAKEIEAQSKHGACSFVDMVFRNQTYTAVAAYNKDLKRNMILLMVPIDDTYVLGVYANPAGMTVRDSIQWNKRGI